MDLPSFIWLWRIAAWSMGLSVTAYIFLLITGVSVWYRRRHEATTPYWLRSLHILLGASLVLLILLLLSIGIVGTIGEHGRLGHSWHLPAGISVVLLVLASASAAAQISTERPWARSLHVIINGFLFVALAAVGLSGWVVVQQYLP